VQQKSKYRKCPEWKPTQGLYVREVAGSREEWKGCNTKKIFVKSAFEIWPEQTLGH